MVVLNLPASHRKHFSLGQFHITDCVAHQYVGHGCEGSDGRRRGVRVAIHLHVRMEQKQEVRLFKNIAGVVGNYINKTLQIDA